MDESNTVVSAYTMYRHLQQYCSHPSILRYNEHCTVLIPLCTSGGQATGPH